MYFLKWSSCQDKEVKERLGFGNIKKEGQRYEISREVSISRTHDVLFEIKKENGINPKTMNDYDIHDIDETDNSARDINDSNILVRGINGTKTFNCVECSYSTKNKAHLLRHIKSVHQKIRDFQCTECKYATGDKGDLRKHLKNVHNEKFTANSV